MSPEYGDPDDAEPGMRLRDYFAARALPALLMSYPKLNHFEVSEMSYGVADAMLEAREN